MAADLPAKLKELEARCGGNWPTIAAACEAATLERAKLAKQLTDRSLLSVDTTAVVFGSLARGEWTAGSDLDWTLVVDGQVDATHAEAARKIKSVFDDVGGKPPGPTGVFGTFTFSHDIVHFIGGNDDSNANTTRRILLLLESKSLTFDDQVRERVLRALLARYVGEDLLYHEPGRFSVPRFLLNDYVRYWRTMGVDSAQKRRDRADKWALRNIKLRLSRKLIFVTGLWACLSCHLHPSPDLIKSRASDDRDAVRDDMTTFLLRFSQQTPLETLADAFCTYSAWPAAKTSFDAYEKFLSMLNDENCRDHLAKLKVDDAMSDTLFKCAKLTAHEFQCGLTDLFFRTDDDLIKATQSYGVF